MNNKNSAHILSTSTNLLGFCLFVITAIHISDKQEGTMIDEFTSFIALFLAISSLMSFFAMKYPSQTKGGIMLENIADILFIISLVGIVILITFLFINFL